MTHTLEKILALYFGLVFASLTAAEAPDPLPSWNEGSPKQAITQFVEAVSTPDGSEFVPPAERIAVFDNDGAL